MSKEDEVLDRGDDFNSEDEIEEEEFETSVEDEEEEESTGEEDGEDEEEDADGEDESESEDEDEGDGEGSEDDDEESDEEDEEEDSGRIPRSRLNEVIAQRDAEKVAREKEEERVNRLEAMVERLIENNSAPPTIEEEEIEEYDFDTSEEKYIDLILEGEVKDALALRKEIDQAKEDALQAKFDIVQSDTKESVATQGKFDTAIEVMEAKYSFLDRSSDDYNEEAVESVNALMSGLMSTGLSNVDALNKAVSRMAPLYEEDAAEEEEERPSKKRKADPKKARKRNIKAAKSQPSRNTGRKEADQDLDTMVVSKLSERAFSKLTTREKKILRGD